MVSPVLENADPQAWRAHRFGLPQDRWSRLGARSFWVTGAGTGFGRAIAVALACAGACVFLSGRRPEKLDEAIEEARSLGAGADRCHALPCDITDPDRVAQAGRAIAERVHSLVGLVNSAAVAQPNEFRWPLQQERLDHWERLLRVNLTAQWLATRTALPIMVRGGEIRVLFLTSEAGWASTPGFGEYNVSKAALNSLGASLAAECADRHLTADVQINVLVPGEARTEMNRAGVASPYTVASMALVLLSHPPGGPNGRFFHRDGRHLGFGYSAPHDRPLIGGPR